MRYILCSLMVLAPAITHAQDDATRLEALIQDKLSNENQIVTVRGFDGLLSSKASLDLLTIADADGIWLTLEDAELEWSQAALLRGALQVDTIRAGTIVFDRLPAPAPVTTADTAATPITFPELPVSVTIDEIRADTITFGEAVFGHASSFQLDGSLSLIDGGGAVDLALDRLDGPIGAVRVQSSYNLDTSIVSLDFNANEAAGGIVSNLLGLPDAPALRLSVSGTGPTDTFAADLRFSGNGADHVSGAFVTSQIDGTRSMEGNIGGDLTPFLDPKYHSFFGTDANVGFVAHMDETGAIEIPNFALDTSELNLSGQLNIGADGRPDQFDIDGMLASNDGSVRLPVDANTQVNRAVITAHFDVEQSELWDFRAVAHGVTQDDIAIGKLTLSGSGLLAADQSSGDIEFATTDMNLGDPALNSAVGTDVMGRTKLIWGAGRPFAATDLYLNAGAVTVTGDALVDAGTDAVEYSLSADVTGTGFDRFSDLAGRQIGGDGDVHIDVSGDVLKRTIAARIDGTMTDLNVGIPELRGLLAGDTVTLIDLARTENGIELRELSIKNAQADIRTSGVIGPNSASLTSRADVVDLARMEAGLTGPAAMSADAKWTKGGLLELTDLTLRGADIALDGSAAFDPDRAIETIAANLDIDVGDLSQFSDLMDRNITGRVDGRVDIDGANVTADLTTANISGVLGEYDRLIAGNGTVKINASGASIDDFELTQFDVSLPRFSAKASGSSDAISFDATLVDLADIAPDFGGAATSRGTLRRGDDRWLIDTVVTALKTANVRVNGSISSDAQSATLASTGTVPLAAVNPFIAPRSATGNANLNLRIDGPLALSSVSGTVATNGARFSEPTSGRALTDIGALVTLADGRASLDISSKIDSGGTVTITGPLTLTTPYETDLDIALRNIVLIDPALYQTEIDGALSLTGGLLSNAKIAGTIDLGATEVRIPDTLGAASGAIPDGLVHVNEPAAVRSTRNLAGLISTSSDSGPSSNTIAMDVTVRALNQIFLRGRGLDAEMGGEIRLTGTTDNVVPVGSFELIRGRLDFLTERLDLTEGEVRIEGSLDPYVLLTAEAETDDVTITVTTEGLMSDPEISFSSSPDLPEDEILAQLIFNSAATDLSALQAIQLASAIATLAGKGGDGIIGNLRESTGLDDLNVSTDDEGNATLEAGKYITENVYTNVEIDSSGQSQINLNIDVTGALTLKGSLGSDGESSIGAFVERDY